MGWKAFWAYLGCSVALAVAPGPDNAFVLAQSVAEGAAAGVIVTLGLCTGLCFHTSLVAFGAAAFLKRCPKAFTAVTCVGALYLYYIAVRTWLAAAPGTIAGTAAAVPAGRLYLRGVVMNVCNPKVMLFFLAFLPRFTDPARGRLLGQFLFLGAVFAAAAFGVFSLVALAGGAVAGFLAAEPGAGFWLQRGSAVALFLIATWFLGGAFRK